MHTKVLKRKAFTRLALSADDCLFTLSLASAVLYDDASLSMSAFKAAMVLISNSPFSVLYKLLINDKVLYAYQNLAYYSDFC